MRRYGAPRTAWVDVRVEAAAVSSGPAATLQFNVQLFNKTATRLPESAMMNFAPPAANQVGAVLYPAQASRVWPGRHRRRLSVD